MKPENLRYRLYEAKDLPGVLKLWEDSSGWGAISEEKFQKWYMSTPYGPCIIIVVTNELDIILGQLVFTPSIFRLNNAEVKAVRASAPIFYSQNLVSMLNG